MNSIKTYLAIAALTMAAPLVSDSTGASEEFAHRVNTAQREELVNDLDDPRYSSVNARSLYGVNRDDIERNILYIDSTADTRDTSARFGTDLLLGLLVLSVSAGVVAAKRKLDEMLE